MADIRYYFTGGNSVVYSNTHNLRVDKYGLYECRCTITCRPDDWEIYAPRLGDKHPEIPWLENEGYDMKNKGPFVEINAIYYGIENNETDPVYELTNTVAEYPIQVHPAFKEWAESSPTIASQIGPNGEFLGFPYIAEKDDEYSRMYGVEGYLSFGEYVWKKTWNVKREPTRGDLMGIGTIDTPDGDPPDPGGDYNWLQTVNSYTKKGNTYQRTIEWRLSGKNGYNPLIYGEG